jgi:hypothetical protein
VAAERLRHGLARALLKLALVLPAAGLIMGCSATGEVDNSVGNVILSIEEVLLVSDPWGDVLTSGGTILDDTASFSFAAVLKSPIANDPSITRPDLQNIALERYEVTFTRTDGGTAVPPGFQRGVSGLVRLSEAGGEEIDLTTLNSLVVLPSTTKAQPPISFLISPGSEPSTNFTNIQLNARIQFFGKTLAGEPVTVVGNLGINLANYGDANQ